MKNLTYTFAIQFTRYYFIVATINVLITVFIFGILDFSYVIGTASTAPFDGLVWIGNWFLTSPQAGSFFPIDSVFVILLMAIPSLAASKFNKLSSHNAENLSADSVALHVARWIRIVWLMTCAMVVLIALFFVLASLSAPMNPAGLAWVIPNIVGAVVSVVWTIRDFPKRVAPISASQVKDQ